VSRLTHLLRQLESKDPQLAADLKREVEALSARRAFGLNFERHIPETVELPGRPIRKGDKVRFLPERGKKPSSVDGRLWRVARIRKTDDGPVAELVRQESPEAARESTRRRVEDLVVVAEFRDPIYPGLVSTGKIERGGDKPFHTVINAENYHALQALLYTHEGKVDAIYIDPPYNSGARDWKYNNNYVDKDDAYRHSKWLAMMERRLKLAKRLLNPSNSVLIATIDEKEYLRLGLLLRQTFPEGRTQMVTSVISQNGTSRDDEFSRVEEYLYLVRLGAQAITRTSDNMLAAEGKGLVSRVWFNFMRTSTVREKLEGQFYPIFIDPVENRILRMGEPLGAGVHRVDPPHSNNELAVWPIRDDGKEATWGAVPATAREILREGFLRVGGFDKRTGRWSIHYVREGDRSRIEAGEIQVVGTRPDGSKELEHLDASQRTVYPKTVWNRRSHDATAHGTRLLKALLPGRTFPFPKSLYAVEDALRFFIAAKPNAVVLDFFAGSGTTAHAVMRLNRQDQGRRQSISVTNNEVSADEHEALRNQGLRPGDEEWEAKGICEFIAKPRINSALTGKAPQGPSIQGDYKFRDEFAIAEGFEENVAYFTLTYEAPRTVAHHRAFEAVAPFLWMRAGSRGRCIQKVRSDFDVADTYGVLFDLDTSHEFIAALSKSDAVLSPDPFLYHG